MAFCSLEKVLERESKLTLVSLWLSVENGHLVKNVHSTFGNPRTTVMHPLTTGVNSAKGAVRGFPHRV